MIRRRLSKWIKSHLPLNFDGLRERKIHRSALSVMQLEDRRVLVSGLTPAQLLHAYGIDYTHYGNIIGNGAGQTIAIVDAFDNPALLSSTDPNYAGSDLAEFDAYFGLPDPPSFTKIAQDGSTNYPASDLGWAGEEALDVEWAHALAPMANIILIEATDSSGNNLYAAVNYAKTIPGVSVVSMSFGADGDDGTASDNEIFTTPAGHQGIAFVKASGDSGSPGGEKYPNVIVVGGTTLNLNSDNTMQSQTAWSGSGGGLASTFARPTYQNGFNISQYRGIPDVSFDADPASGVAVYDRFSNGEQDPWEQVGGTSLATPCWAAILSITDQFRVAAGKTTLDGATQVLPALYDISSAGIYGASSYDYYDVTSGSNGSYNAGPGYDLVTGLGTPYVNLLANDLAGVNGDLEYFAPNSGTNNISVQVSNGYIQIFDNNVLVSGKSISTTNNVIIHGAAGVTNNVDVTSSYDSVQIPFDFIGDPTGTNSLTIEGTTTADQIIINPSLVEVNYTNITYSNVTNLIANGNGGGDVFDVTPSTSTFITVNGGSPGASLDYHALGTINYTSPTSGTITASGYPIFTFTGINSLTTDNNLVFFAPSGQVNNIIVQLNAGNIQILDNSVVEVSRPITSTAEVIVRGAALSENDVTCEPDFDALNIPFQFLGGIGGTNTLTIVGEVTYDNFTVNSTSVVMDSKNFTYSNVQSLTVEGNGGTDYFDVTPSASTSYTIIGGFPDGTIYYHGAGAINYTSSDSGTISAIGYANLTFSQISKVILSGELIYSIPAYSSHNVTVQVAGGIVEILDNGVIQVAGAAVDTTKVLLYGGDSSNDVIVSDTTFTSTTIPIYYTAGNGSTNLLQIEGGTAADNFTIGSTTTSVNGKLFNYTGLQTLIADGNGGGDTFDVTPSTTMTIDVNGGTPGGTLTYEAVGEFTYLSPTTGAINATGTQPVNYTGIVNKVNFPLGFILELVGNAPSGSTDTFTIASGGSGNGLVANVNGITPTSYVNGTILGVVVTGSTNNDNLVIDNSNGFVAGFITFNGGSATNLLNIVGAPGTSIARETVTMNGTNSGTVILDPTGALGVGATSGNKTTGNVIFNDVPTLLSTTPVGELDFIGSTSAETYTLNDGSLVSGSQMLQLQDATTTSTETLNTSNAGTLTINGFGGTDTFNLNEKLQPTGIGAVKVYGNELTNGTLNTSTSNDTFIVNSTAPGITTTVTGGTTSSFQLNGSGLAGNNYFLGNAGTASFVLNTGTGITATSVNLSGGASSSADTFVVNGITSATNNVALKLGLTPFGQSLQGLGTNVQFDSLPNFTFNGGASVNNFSVIDSTGNVYGTVGPKTLNLASGMIYRPLSSTSGDVRFNVGNSGLPLNGNQTPFIKFNNITGSLSLNGDGTNSASKDILTILGVSATGSSSGSVFGEVTAANPSDQVMISDSLVTISNASLGTLLAVNLNPGTFSTIMYRAGNKNRPNGDTINVVPSKKVNLLIDGMGGKLANTINIVGTASKTYTNITTPSLGGPQLRVTQSTGASVGLINVSGIQGVGLIAVSVAYGGLPLVNVYDPSNLTTPKFVLQPFATEYRGGIEVAVGDVNGDGVPDIVCMAGIGGDAHIVVFSGIDGSILQSYFAYANYEGQASIAVGDVNGDGYADIITGSGVGTAPHVKVFSGKDGSLLQSFYAFSTGFLGGINVAAGDVEDTGISDIIVGAASGSSPHVEVFRGTDLTLIRSFLAFAPGFLGGVDVASVDLNGDGHADLVVAAASGNDPHVEVFDGVTNNLIASFLVPNNYPSGTASASTPGNLNIGTASGANGIGQILVGRSNSTTIQRFQLLPTLAPLTPLNAFDSATGWGVYVGGA
ncbi:FG-GAP repeat protein [Telmatocola sphagniphila]|uniref:FG-GAP repeat protein n=1 Tax=Telmatocola sphagniphila TaxID=1123043 RepID=A0A8E6EYJ2_9BACT|nr:FG-GAP-like repeat-containing protein [Telmatocola sphagniphila]QVL32426.1 FG-GAP repeat protein [Telmatocola sphagniphila]